MNRLQNFKITASGEIVDMRNLSKKELKALLQFYQGKLKRARSNDMKRAYSKCVDQISQFIYEGHVSRSPDVFNTSQL